jgi:hypothetical protein
VGVGGNGCGGSVAEVWNGRVWSLADAGLPACSSHLRSASCTSGSACLAVGGACDGGYTCNAGDVGGGVVESWDGRSWSAVGYTTPYPVSLLGVSCPVRDGCAVVGLESTGQSLVGWWNGSGLSFLALGFASFGSTPSGGTLAAMNGVSCTSVHFCQAVGFSSAFAEDQIPQAITWNGRAWGQPTDPPAAQGPRGRQQPVMGAVSCVAAGDCVALDGFTGGDGADYFDRLSAGRWESATHDPSVIGEWNEADAVWCRSLARCVTVGVHLSPIVGDLGPMAAAGEV